MRGNPTHSISVPRIYGSIPACAGEPPRPKRPTDPTSVYPRVCGGTTLNRIKGAAANGLSPRVRGNHEHQGAFKGRQRSIPACAGEPRSGCAALPRGWVYPRVCGGTYQRRPLVRYPYGLSPRVRGNQTGANVRGGAIGSIPACAGEPLSAGSGQPAWEVYPRVCGGTASLIAATPSTVGLSPRVRGNLDQPALELPLPGSIPACAGEPRL